MEEMSIRNKELIYLDHRKGMTDEQIYEKYKCKYSIETIKKIYKRQNDMIVHRKKLLDDIYDFIYKEYNKLNATRIRNILGRYMYSHSLYFKDDIRKLVYSDMYIRGIGEYSRDMIKDYFTNSL